MKNKALYVAIIIVVLLGVALFVGVLPPGDSTGRLREKSDVQVKMYDKEVRSKSSDAKKTIDTDGLSHGQLVEESTSSTYNGEEIYEDSGGSDLPYANCTECKKSCDQELQDCTQSPSICTEGWDQCDSFCDDNYFCG